MRAIHIDSVNRTVTEVELANAYPDGNKLIGVDLITTAGQVTEKETENTLFVDDEGLLKSPTVFFYCPLFYPTPLAGSGFILGADTDGETVPANIDLEEVKKNVRFFDLASQTDYIEFYRLVR